MGGQEPVGKRKTGAMDAPVEVYSRLAGKTLLLAGFADHLKLGCLQVSMLLGIGINRFFGLFLGSMHVRMPDFAAHRHRVSQVRRKLNGGTSHFPRASILASDLEFSCAIAL